MNNNRDKMAKFIELSKQRELDIDSCKEYFKEKITIIEEEIEARKLKHKEMTERSLEEAKTIVQK